MVQCPPMITASFQYFMKRIQNGNFLIPAFLPHLLAGIYLWGTFLSHLFGYLETYLLGPPLNKGSLSPNILVLGVSAWKQSRDSCQCHNSTPLSKSLQLPSCLLLGKGGRCNIFVSGPCSTSHPKGLLSGSWGWWRKSSNSWPFFCLKVLRESWR